MLAWFVVLYLVISVGIGLFAARHVHSSKDFAVAGRHLPLPMVMATVFATWFGAETVFGISATFVKEGLQGVVADPFGAALCLVIAGWFFATYLYKLNILTLGDYYRLRYNRTVEVLTTLCIVASYLGWVSAQVKAMSLVFGIISNDVISPTAGIVLGASVALIYTMIGGMLSVAVLDFVQMVVIMAGLLFIGYLTAGMTGGVVPVVAHAAAAGKLDFFPAADPLKWIGFIGAGITMMFGSVPQQDVFQRITSAKSARIALTGSLLGALLYILFAFVPMFIAYAATLIDPAMFNGLLEQDSQLVLPTLVMQHMPLVAQILFFGAVLSAIMSTSSATLLAPSVAFAENIVRGFFPHMGDKSFLLLMRVTVFVFTLLVLAFALFSEDTIFGMVENAYKITLAGAFVPLIVGPLWKRANTQGALFSIFFGIGAWLLAEYLVSEGGSDVTLAQSMGLASYGYALIETGAVPAQLVGVLASFLGMAAGSLLPHWIGRPNPHDQSHALLHHHAAAQTHHLGEALHRHPDT
jgi:solute:Na+ symporter, SSS family